LAINILKLAITNFKNTTFSPNHKEKSHFLSTRSQTIIADKKFFKIKCRYKKNIIFA